MSPKDKSKPAGAKARPPKEKAERKLLRPAGQPAGVFVEARHGQSMERRTGRGYSLGELSAAGLSGMLARAWRVPLDIRRRSVLNPNVESLKSWAGQPRHVGRTESRVEVIEGDIKKAEMVIEKEAAKVKRGAEKLEKEAVEKIEEPVKRRARRKKAKAD